MGRKAEVSDVESSARRDGNSEVFREFDVVQAIQSCAVLWHLAQHDMPSQLNPFIDQNRINAYGSE